MTMHKSYRGGLPTAIPFAPPATWSPEQALAVNELLDDLCERLWRHHEVALHHVVREHIGEPASDDRLF